MHGHSLAPLSFSLSLVRRKICMSILTSALSTERKSSVFVGQAELLARLISDGMCYVDTIRTSWAVLTLFQL